MLYTPSHLFHCLTQIETTVKAMPSSRCYRCHCCITWPIVHPLNNMGPMLLCNQCYVGMAPSQRTEWLIKQMDLALRLQEQVLRRRLMREQQTEVRHMWMETTEPRRSRKRPRSETSINPFGSTQCGDHGSAGGLLHEEDDTDLWLSGYETEICSDAEDDPLEEVEYCHALYDDDDYQLSSIP